MQHIVKEYLLPLRALAKSQKDSAPLSVVQINGVFSNVETIFQLNGEFLKSLRERLVTWTPEKGVVGDLFLDFAPFFKM